MNTSIIDKSTPADLTTVLGVIGFFSCLIKHENLNMHPDTPFEDYVQTGTDKPSYTPEQVAHRNALRDKAFDVCEKEGADVYQLSMIADPIFEWDEELQTHVFKVN